MGMSASQARLLTLTARMSDLEFQAQQTSNSKIRLATQSEEVANKYSQALDKKRLVFQTGVNNSTPTYVNLTANLLTGFQAISSTETQRLLKDTAGRLLVSTDVSDAFSNAGGDLEKFLNHFGFTKTQPTTTPAAGAPKYDSAALQYYTNIYNAIASGGSVTESNDNLNSQDWLYNQLQNGNLSLEKYSSTANNGNGGFDSVSWQSGDTSIQQVTDDTDMAKAEADYDASMASINNKDKRFDLELKNIDTEHSAIQTEIDSVKKVVDKNIERSFKIFG